MRNCVTAVIAFCLLGCHSNDNPTKKSATMHNSNKKTVSWAHSTNIYEVNVRQYTKEGTFAAFMPELPRLKDMGVQTLWFMPITPIAQKNKKGPMGSPYACSDYTSINPEFGTLDDFKKLVKEAHAQGFKVIIDWVANHTGWDHVWTKEHPEYYLRDSATNDFHIASGMDDIIELDFSNPALRKAMIDAMKYWVTECDIDGFRCDLAAWVELDFWQEARPKVDSVKHLFWLGEFDELQHGDYGKVFDASYSWTWMHTTKNFYNNRLPFAVLDTLLSRYSHLGDESMRAWFTTNHDENSWNGTEYDKYGDMAKTLAVFSATWNGVPLLYSGQEMPNRKKLEFFEKDPIAWTGKYELHDFYKTLLNLHASNPALRGGDSTVTVFRLHTSQDAHVFAFVRRKGDDEVMVLLNFSDQLLSVEMKDDKLQGNFSNIFKDGRPAPKTKDVFEMQPWEYQVYEK